MSCHPSLRPQATHPYFGRVSFSAGARFEAEAAFLQSHYWDKVVCEMHTHSVTVHSIAYCSCDLSCAFHMPQIAIKDSANPLPTVMYHGFEKFDIKIVLEVLKLH